jgi:hypothetical protein
MRYDLNIWRSVLGAILTFALFGAIELVVGFGAMAIAVGNGLGENCPGGCSRTTGHDILVLAIVGGSTLLLVSMLATRSILGHNREILGRGRRLLLAALAPVLSIGAAVFGPASHSASVAVVVALAAAVGWAWTLRSEVSSAAVREAARFSD